MTDTKHYDITYINHPDGQLIGEIESFSFDEMWKLRELSNYLSDGDLLRCFSELGIVDTYFLRVEEHEDWPPIFRFSKNVRN